MDNHDFEMFLDEMRDRVEANLWGRDWSKRNIRLTVQQELDLVDILNKTPDGMLAYFKITRPNDWFHTPLDEAIQKTVTYNSHEGFEMFAEPRMDTIKIRVCPACKDHVYGTISCYHDCKNEFVTTIQKPDGTYGVRTVGQCECSGPAHGRRK